MNETVDIRADHVPGGHIRINASDFDSAKMQLWSSGAAPATAPATPTVPGHTVPRGAAHAAPAAPTAPTAAAVAAAETVVAAALAEYEAAHPGAAPAPAPPPVTPVTPAPAPASTPPVS